MVVGSGPLDTSLRQRLGGHTDLTPDGVVDALGVAVVAGDTDEVGLEREEADVVGHRRELLLEIPLLLEEQDFLQGVGGVQRGCDLAQTGVDRLGRPPATALRLVGLEGGQVGLDDATVLAAGGQGRSALCGHPANVPISLVLPMLELGSSPEAAAVMK